VRLFLLPQAATPGILIMYHKVQWLWSFECRTRCRRGRGVFSGGSGVFILGDHYRWRHFHLGGRGAHN